MKKLLPLLAVFFFQNISATNPCGLVITANISSVTQVAGNNGAIQLNVSGGVTPYTFEWINGATTAIIGNLHGGFYDLTITDGTGCTTDTLFFISAPEPPGWNITQTGLQAMVMFNEPSNVLLDNIPLPPGSYVGAFVKSAGVDACFGYVPWNGYSTSFMVSFSSVMNLTWKVFDAVSGQAYTARSCASSNTGFYYDLNMGVPTSIWGLFAKSDMNQYISFTNGWSMFGLTVIPHQPDMVDLFAPVINNLLIVKDDMGKAYWPAYGVNLIGNALLGEGYQVKMNQLTSLSVSGDMVYPENHSLNLPAGWSMFGYYSTRPVNPSIIFGSPPFTLPNTQIIKNGSGYIWWPLWGLDNLGNLQPGEGYSIKLNYAEVFNLPLSFCN
jgi:hypothetical protein